MLNTYAYIFIVGAVATDDTGFDINYINHNDVRINCGIK